MKHFLTSSVFLIVGILARPCECQTNQEKRWHYTGKIDGKYEIYVDVSAVNATVQGHYFYYTVGKPIDLEGTLGNDLSFTLNESIGGKITGTFKGRFSKDYSTAQGQWHNPDNTKQLSFTLSMFAKTAFFESKEFDVRYSYPQFTFGNASLNKKLNSTFKTTATDDINGFIELSQEYQEEGWSLFTDYNIGYWSETLLSILFTRYESTGGAHPNSYYESLNYSMTSNTFSSLELGDLFTQGSNYLKELSEFCLKDLEIQQASFVVDGTIEDLGGELTTFTIMPKELQFHFHPYIVGCYAEGPYTVSVPYNAINHIIEKTGPLKEFF